MSTRIPVGPQHPSLIEPEHLDVKVDGETITAVDVHLGYIHRGIEGLMQKKTYQQNVFIAERICGICSGVHTSTYSEGIESLLGLEVPKRAKYIRTIILELERLHSHYLWLGLVAYEIGLDTAFQISWRDREIVLDILEKITGNRINYAMNTIGGVRRDITKEMQKETLQGIDALWEKTKYYKEVFLKDSIVRARTKNVGVLKKRDAERYSVAGPIVRASSVNFDVRTTNYAAYADVKWKPIVRHGCDINSRLDVRIEEVFDALNIIRQCIENMPEGPLKTIAPQIVPKGETIMRTEAPRG
ncbi:MAG: nickel-dependent hydrogenase large subunit, partial [Candidatus Aenigmarchaeota archaeon]|nr:nickel-dependent hydrogenase large subunit [Candidatus Aenigmarchaeota archaeon]